MLQEFWHNFTHNLFKPLLLFFYFGFLIPILKVRFEFPYVLYQGLTMYLLLAIGWHGGEELAKIPPSSIASIVGFMAVGFVLNFLIGGLAYLLLSWLTVLVEFPVPAGFLIRAIQDRMIEKGELGGHDNPLECVFYDSTHCATVTRPVRAQRDSCRRLHVSTIWHRDLTPIHIHR